MAADPNLIREYTIRSFPTVMQAAQQLNALTRAGWHLHSVVPDGRLHLLVMFRLIPRPAEPNPKPGFRFGPE